MYKSGWHYSIGLRMIRGRLKRFSLGAAWRRLKRLSDRSSDRPCGSANRLPAAEWPESKAARTGRGGPSVGRPPALQAENASPRSDDIRLVDGSLCDTRSRRAADWRLRGSPACSDPYNPVRWNSYAPTAPDLRCTGPYSRSTSRAGSASAMCGRFSTSAEQSPLGILIGCFRYGFADGRRWGYCRSRTADRRLFGGCVVDADILRPAGSVATDELWLRKFDVDRVAGGTITWLHDRVDLRRAALHPA